MATPRLSGKIAAEEIIEGLFVHTHSSMAEAIRYARIGQADLSKTRRKSFVVPDSVMEEALCGNDRLPGLVERADPLIDEAILIDPRLNRKHGWVRAEEGIDADAALVSAGEPNCCLDRRRIKLAEASTTQEPVKIVISTDSAEDACDAHVVAFIAAAKLAQQFRPLEIWWQGAWLSGQYAGQVLLAPLIQGDMDFSRVQFFLSHTLRDKLSYRCMWYHCATVPSGGQFNGTRRMHQFGKERAERSHLPDTFDFIRETGIKSDPQYIATLAARWAGLESAWYTQVSDSSAEQWWRDRSKDEPYRAPVETEQEREARRKQWDREDKERERQRKLEAEKREKQAI